MTSKRRENKKSSQFHLFFFHSYKFDIKIDTVYKACF